MFAQLNVIKTLCVSLVLVLAAGITTPGAFTWLYSAVGCVWLCSQLLMLARFDFSGRCNDGSEVELL